MLWVDGGVIHNKSVLPQRDVWAGGARRALALGGTQALETAAFIVLGQGGKAEPFGFCTLDDGFIWRRGVHMHEKMQSGVFFLNGNAGGERAVFQAIQKQIPLVMVKVPHTVHVPFKMPILEKTGQGILLKIGYGTGVKAHVLAETVPSNDGAAPCS